MAKTNYLGENGIVYLITLIKNELTSIRNAFVKKTLKTGSESEYKVLSDNDLTDELKNHYDAAYSHSTQPHAPSYAQANVIETVKVNGSPLSVTLKEVDIPVPLISTDISTDGASTLKAASPKAVADYVTSALSGITGISFSVLTSGQYDAQGVPTVAGDAGTIYLVPISGANGDNIYTEFIYINNSFEQIGTTAVDLTGYLKSDELIEFTNDEIQSLWTSVA